MEFLRRHYLSVLFFIIGTIIGFFINRLPLEFEPKTNWVSLASFFLTIALAIYLEFVVRPSFSNNRNEKDLLIDQLKAIQKDLRLLQDGYENMRNTQLLASNLKSDIVSRLRNISNQIDLLTQTDELCTITRSNEISEKVFKYYLLYKRSLTGYGFDKPDFSYDRRYWNKHETAFKNFTKAILHAIIEINKK